MGSMLTSDACFQDEREAVLSELSAARSTVQQLQVELEKYRESDPEVLEQQKREAGSALEAANRWTGNIDGQVTLTDGQLMYIYIYSWIGDIIYTAGQVIYTDGQVIHIDR